MKRSTFLIGLVVVVLLSLLVYLGKLYLLDLFLGWRTGP